MKTINAILPSNAELATRLLKFAEICERQGDVRLANTYKKRAAYLAR